MPNKQVAGSKQKSTSADSDTAANERYSEIILNEAESRDLNKSQRTAMRLRIAAADLLEDRSVTDLRVGDIAQQAGVAHGTFYTHYSNSREIIQAILDEYFDILDRKLRPVHAVDEFTRIRDTTAAFIRFYRQNLGLMRCIRALSEQDAVFAAQKRQIDATWYNRNIAHLSRTDAGKTMSTEKIRLLVYALGSMVEDFLYVRFQNPDPIVVDMTQTEDDAAQKLAMIWYRTIYLSDPLDSGH
jgi:AcrR family transcriptional regulator